MKPIKVKHLKAGMTLSSGTKVVSDPVSLTKTPKGMVQIGVEYPNGKLAAPLWNKETTVKILEKTFNP